jgi:hypothetical protein
VPAPRRLNPATLSLEGSVRSRTPGRETGPRPPPPPPPGGRRATVEHAVPRSSAWEIVKLDSAARLRGARRGVLAVTEGSSKGEQRGLAWGNPAKADRALTLAGGRRKPAESVFDLEFIAVEPGQRFSATVRFTGDLRIQLAEYDGEGKLIGSQWTNSVYLEESAAIYTVVLTEETHWVAVGVDNPGVEETTLHAVVLSQRDAAGPGPGGAGNE